MESLSTAFFGSPPLQTHFKIKKPLIPKPISITHFNSSLDSHLSLTKPNLSKTITLTTITTSTALYTLPCFATETVVASSAEKFTSDKISLEAVLVSIDEFFGRYPFFVAGCAFIWLVVTPLARYYFSKCKYIYTIDAFKKLRDDPNAQLLDIRDDKSLKFLKSPNLKLLNKNVVQVQFLEDDSDGFVKKVLENFSDPGNTVVCILDNVDGNSMKVAELLVKSGFKEAYAIKGGVGGSKGWLQIQEKLLPPSLHILPRKKSKKSRKLGEKNGGVTLTNDKSTDTEVVREIDNRDKFDSLESKLDQKVSSRSSSPYPNYPDLKPPASPTPSKPSK